VSLDGFSLHWRYEYYSKIYRENSSFVKIRGTLRENLSTFMIIYLSSRLRMRNVPDKSCRENQNKRFVFFFRKSCHLWDNVEKGNIARQATDDNITRRMRFACWVTASTQTHTQHV
jgi:hypothetical protein